MQISDAKTPTEARIAPQELNGHPVLFAQYVEAKQGFYVVVRRAPHDHLTAFWASHMGEAWEHGHYGFKTRSEAYADMIDRLRVW
jgi:hypothetical protein